MYKLTIKGARVKQVKNISHFNFEKNTCRVITKGDVTTVSYKGSNEKKLNHVVRQLLKKTGQNVQVAQV